MPRPSKRGSVVKDKRRTVAVTFHVEEDAELEEFYQNTLGRSFAAAEFRALAKDGLRWRQREAGNSYVLHQQLSEICEQLDRMENALKGRRSEVPEPYITDEEGVDVSELPKDILGNLLNAG